MILFVLLPCMSTPHSLNEFLCLTFNILSDFEQLHQLGQNVMVRGNRAEERPEHDIGPAEIQQGGTVLSLEWL